MSTDSNHAVVKLSLSSQGPSFQHPRFGFSNTLSAIKHNDSVGRGGVALCVSHSIHLCFSEKMREENTCKPFVSLQICLSTSSFYLWPRQLRSNLCTQKHWDADGGTGKHSPGARMSLSGRTQRKSLCLIRHSKADVILERRGTYDLLLAGQTGQSLQAFVHAWSQCDDLTI